MTTAIDDEVEWVDLYGKRPTAFFRGRARGDFYLTDPERGVWRARVWRDDRLQGGDERLLRTKELARAAVLEMLERAKQQEGEG